MRARQVVRCFVKGAPDQLLARADRVRRGPSRRPSDGDSGAYLAENNGWAGRACA